jgi:hypothetical protein
VAAGADSPVPNWVDFPPARPDEPEVEEAIEAGFTHMAEGLFPPLRKGAFVSGGPADTLEPCSVLAEVTGQAGARGRHGSPDR